ncbi:MAG TPA: prepilin peptidase [Solirubrobacteraceae bacterium]|jgi:leader peptidase (prepilin peptidase)/N-methyltransferase|nr:prepilin peptidase [Solirubrobacteraceae bacterium]
MQATFAGVLGAIMGSFLNVVVHRLPRHESLISPASHCPTCETPIRPYDNVPILSWLLLRGRCRGCGARISARYPLLEAGTALLCIGAVLTNGSVVGVALGVTLVLALVPAAAIDLEHRIIPNVITGTGAVLALALGTALDPSGEPVRLIAGAGAGGFLLLAALAHPAGMGMGDVKLAGMMGLFLGAAVAPALLLALLAGVLAGVLVIARSHAHEGGVRSAGKTGIPFGPFLALGGLAGIFAGQAAIDWYTTTFLH